MLGFKFEFNTNELAVLPQSPYPKGHWAKTSVNSGLRNFNLFYAHLVICTTQVCHFSLALEPFASSIITTFKLLLKNFFLEKVIHLM